MLKRLKRLVIGRPLKNEALEGEKFGILLGLPILASDAVSSVAYAGQEILLVLVPMIGILSYQWLAYISIGIIGLLLLLVLSYRQTIESYPNGGGAYIVAKENIGVTAGVTAGAALSVDYILTVAVSISAGIDAITTACPNLLPYKVLLAVGVSILLMIGNLRGLRESGKIFSIPPFAFILGLVVMIGVGFFKWATGNYTPIEHSEKVLTTTGVVSLFLVMSAFSNGCSALTGVEAVSNAVPNFKTPSVKNARMVLLLLGIIIMLLFGGTSIIANIYQVEPNEHQAVLVQIAQQIFGNGSFMYYYIMITTFTILVMAANTAYSGFPMLLSIMGKEGYVPKQLSMRGDRLSYSNGIIVLTSIAILLIVSFHGSVTKLIGLYAIGVFISFTLSQSGMFLRWKRLKGKSWHIKATINGFGALVTGIVVFVIARTKFSQGAFIVVIILPLLVFLMLKVKRHYIAVSKQLKISTEELQKINLTKDIYKNRVIVPIASINQSSIRALRYAKTISDNVTAFCVSIDEENAEKMRERYNMLNSDIPLIIKLSPFRKIIDPLLKFIESAEYEYNKGDMITVILPQFAVKSWWHNVLHNQTILFIKRELLKHKHIVVAIMPLQLKDDNFVLKNTKYKDR